MHINLTNSNTTYWFDGLSPNTFSSRYTLGYYTDDTLKTRIGKLTSLPSRKGWKFNGYYVKRSNFDKIDQIASTDDLLINSNGFFETSYGLLKDNDTKEIIGFSVEPNRYKISFDANGGSGGTTVIKDWPYEHDMPTITLPGRAGYTFEGYYTAASGGDRYYNANGTESRIFNPSTPGDLKLYAHWTICPAGSYCPGDNSARGCPSGYTSSTGASNIHDCFNYLRAYKTCYSYNSGTYTGVGHTCVLGTSGWYYNTYTKTGMSFCHASSQDCACSGNEGYDGCGYYSSCTPEISYGWGGQNSNYTVSCSTSSFGCNSSHVNWEYTISCTKHNY